MPAPDAIACDKLAKLAGMPKSPVLFGIRRNVAHPDLAQPDLGQPDLAQGCAGLSAAPLALSRMSSGNHARPAAAMALCNAIYRRTQDMTVAIPPWPANTPRGT